MAEWRYQAQYNYHLLLHKHIKWIIFQVDIYQKSGISPILAVDGITNTISRKFTDEVCNNSVIKQLKVHSVIYTWGELLIQRITALIFLNN